MKANINDRENILYPQREANQDCVIYGSSFHKPKEKLVELYISNSLNKYLYYEATHSAGDYVLIDHSGVNDTIITSPGFSGGYIQTKNNISISRTLQPVLSNISQNKLSISQSIFSLFIHKDQTSMLPISTIFDQVHRLPPGTVLQVQDSSVTEQTNYLQKGKSSHNFFGKSLEEALSHLAEIDTKPTLMYSGGVDSTAFYYALKESLDENDFRVVSIDIGPNTNSLSHAKKMGEEYNIEIEPIEFGWPPTGKNTLRVIEDALTKDIIDPLNPHWALHGSKGDQVIISGQNMDAMSTTNMHRPQTTYLNHVLATKSISKVLKQIMSNFQYTKLYRRSRILQRVLSATVSKAHDSNTQAASNCEGYYTGQISTGHPNISNKCKPIYDEEIQLLSELIEVLSPKMVGYLHYQHNAAKLISTYATQGTEVHLPSMWGPVAAYYLNKQQTVTDALSPKREVYEYVNKKGKKDHKSISYQSKRDYLASLEQEQSHKRSMESRLLQKNIRYFNPNRSYVLNMIGTDSSTLRKEYSKAQDRIPQKMDIALISRYHRILNIEKILESTFSQ